jgi:plastocyanin
MVKFEFNPGSSAVPVDGTLLIRNSDSFVHDFTLDALDVAVTVGPGSETLVDLSGHATGTYVHICSLHSDGETGMIGTITVSG